MYTLSGTTFIQEVYKIPQRPVVVLNKSWEETHAQEKSLLEKILSLGNTSLNQVGLLTTDQFELKKATNNLTKVIAFGLSIDGATVNEISSLNEMNIIVTQDLTTLETASKETKQKLATAVKHLLT